MNRFLPLALVLAACSAHGPTQPAGNAPWRDTSEAAKAYTCTPRQEPELTLASFPTFPGLPSGRLEVECEALSSTERGRKVQVYLRGSAFYEGMVGHPLGDLPYELAVPPHRCRVLAENVSLGEFANALGRALGVDVAVSAIAARRRVAMFHAGARVSDLLHRFGLLYQVGYTARDEGRTLFIGAEADFRRIGDRLERERQDRKGTYRLARRVIEIPPGVPPRQVAATICAMAPFEEGSVSVLGDKLFVELPEYWFGAVDGLVERLPQMIQADTRATAAAPVVSYGTPIARYHPSRRERPADRLRFKYPLADGPTGKLEIRCSPSSVESVETERPKAADNRVSGSASQQTPPTDKGDDRCVDVPAFEPPPPSRALARKLDRKCTIEAVNVPVGALAIELGQALDLGVFVSTRLLGERVTLRATGRSATSVVKSLADAGLGARFYQDHGRDEMQEPLILESGEDILDDRIQRDRYYHRPILKARIIPIEAGWSMEQAADIAFQNSTQLGMVSVIGRSIFILDAVFVLVKVEEILTEIGATKPVKTEPVGRPPVPPPATPEVLEAPSIPPGEQPPDNTEPST